MGRHHRDGVLGTVAVTVSDRLTALGIVLPGPYPPHDPLDAVVVHGGRARTWVSSRATTTA